jgi:hypothetical protein
MIIVSIVNDLFTGYTKGLKPKWGFFSAKHFLHGKEMGMGVAGWSW